MTRRLEVGRIVKAHGIRGEVLVALTTDRTERVKRGAVLYAGDRPLEVLTSIPHQGKWIVAFDRIYDRNTAETLHGLVLSAEPIDDPDALWIHELIGSEVVDPAGAVIGVCESVQDNPAADLLVLAGSGALVPVTFVVDATPGRVVVDLPAGLLELFEEGKEGKDGKEGKEDS